MDRFQLIWLRCSMRKMLKTSLKDSRHHKCRLKRNGQQTRKGLTVPESVIWLLTSHYSRVTQMESLELTPV